MSIWRDLRERERERGRGPRRRRDLARWANRRVRSKEDLVLAEYWAWSTEYSEFGTRCIHCGSIDLSACGPTYCAPCSGQDRLEGDTETGGYWNQNEVIRVLTARGGADVYHWEPTVLMGIDFTALQRE